MPDKMPRVRRVGTFTAGITLIIVGTAMVLTLLFPQLPMAWVLKFSPLMLVLLGAEVLYSNHTATQETVKYDWAAVLLCLFVVCTALFLYAGAVCMAGEFPALLRT